MRLSYSDLRDIALQILSDYYRTPTLPFKALDIDDFAAHYMRLTVRYHKFPSVKRTILGCIAYENTVLEVDNEKLRIDKRTVFLNECLKPDTKHGRWNFTLAHECSHQAIYLLDPASYNKYQCREYGRSYSLRELTSSDDWFKWQANTLAAELLMPCHLIIKLFEKHKYRGKVRIYPENKLLYPERRIIRSMAALLIRLKQMRLLDFRSMAEYLREEEIDCLIGTAIKLSEEYFNRVRGEQDELRASVTDLKREEHYCVYCQRKTAVTYSHNTNYGQKKVMQVICPKCKREILTAVSFRSVSFRTAS